MPPPRFGRQLDMPFPHLPVSSGEVLNDYDGLALAKDQILAVSNISIDAAIELVLTSDSMVVRMAAIPIFQEMYDVQHQPLGISIGGRLVDVAWASAQKTGVLWNEEIDLLTTGRDSDDTFPLWSKGVRPVGLSDKVPDLEVIIAAVVEQASKASGEEIARALGWIRHPYIRRRLVTDAPILTGRVLDASLAHYGSAVYAAARPDAGAAELHHLLRSAIERVVSAKPITGAADMVPLLATMTSRGIPFPPDVLEQQHNTPDLDSMLHLANPATSAKDLLKAMKARPGSVQLALIALSRVDWGKPLADGVSRMVANPTAGLGWPLIFGWALDVPTLSPERLAWILEQMAWCPATGGLGDLTEHPAWGEELALGFLGGSLSMDIGLNGFLWHPSVRHLPKIRAHMERYASGRVLAEVLQGSERKAFMKHWPRLAAENQALALDTLRAWAAGGRMVPLELIESLVHSTDGSVRAGIILLCEHAEEEPSLFDVLEAPASSTPPSSAQTR